MKAGFTLLVDDEMHNLVRKIAWQMHQQYGTNLRTCLLPPHVSLKQPFVFDDLARLEAFGAAFARSIQPFEVILTELQVLPAVVDDKETGLLWIEIQESETLRRLHNRLNDELSHLFDNTQAPFDGPDYHFHMTVIMGDQPFATYRQFYDGMPDPGVKRKFTATNLGLFVSDVPPGSESQYICYKIIPLGQPS